MNTNEPPAAGRDAMRYPQIVRAVSETPWAILPERLAAILEVIQLRAQGYRFTDEEIRERIGAGPARRQPAAQATVAVLPLYGVIIPRATMVSRMSGGTSVTEYAVAFRAALNDPEIDAILLDIDSPGGSTDLVPEFAAEVRAARGTKPIVAIANTMAASAAYWIGSQADELVVTPSGEVGSIGVFAAHEDISGLQEKAGIKTTLIKAGRFKAENSPFEPLTEEARAAIQQRVDEFYGMFVAAVAKGRGVSVNAVREGFGEGRIVTAKAAVAEGMVDRIDTFEATIARLVRGARASGDAAALSATGAVLGGPSFADEATAARDAALALVTRARSLAELRVEGRLTAAKRDQLSALHASLAEVTGALAELLAETDKHKQAMQREHARLLHEHI